MDKSFERRYSINVARLKSGKHTDHFSLDRAFFEQYEGAIIENADVQIDLDIIKYETHLDVTFYFKGHVMLPCDRCGEPYLHPINLKERIIYAFDRDMDFEGYEVMYVSSQESHLVIAQELYDFLTLAIPIRKVPDKNIHLCSPEVLAILGLDEHGEPLDIVPEESIDPRWEKLKELKNKNSN